MSTKRRNLDLFLGEVFKQFIAIKDDDYKKSQEVFKSVFDQVKQKMGEKCNYFGKYGTQFMYAGSVYDGIKVSKLDEFDMDIVIRLPINYEEIIIENDQPGYLKLKIESAFDNLDKQSNWEKCHKVTRDWRDTEKYLLQNKFRRWIHGVVQKALNDLNGKVTVNDVTYILKYKESGPAYTLNVQNDKGNEEFKLDVDLVPVIRFMHPRWPEGYRTIEDTSVKEWLVVPKPNKAISDDNMKNRCWRLSFQEFERDMMKGCQQLKTTIRLVKKLRDSLQMKDIASYYIKTLFLWKVHNNPEKKYWQNKLSITFRIMVEDLYKAIKDKNIPYYWNDSNNLLDGLKPTVQKLYTDKLKEVLDSIDANDVDKVIFYLLTTEELQLFKKSEFYEKQPKCVTPISVNVPLTSQISRQDSIASNSSDTKAKLDNDLLHNLVKAMNKKLNAFCESNSMIELMKSLNDKMDALNEKVDRQNERLEKLEGIMTDKMDTLTDKVEDQNEKLMLEYKKITNSIKDAKAMSCEVSNAVANLVPKTAELHINHNQISLE